MMLAEHFKIGLTSVRKSRFRSGITILGIVVGIVSVITIVSLGEGLKRQVSSQMDDMGTNLLSVRPGKIIERNDKGDIENVNILASTGIASLTQKDVEEIRKDPNVEQAVALGTISGIPRYGDTAFKEGFVVVTSPDLTKTIDYKIEFGSFLDNNMANKKSAVIGANVASKLFNESVPIGKSFNFRDHDFTVEGVFAPVPTSPVSSGADFNDAVFISEPIAQTLYGANVPIYEILIKPKAGVDQDKLIGSLTTALTANHAGQEDFTVLKQDELSLVTGELLKLMTQMIVGMAAITLFVGGIGIMNVMLVSVSERTREIGIRKAIGATNRQIRNQFMAEAIILSIWGALSGLVISGLVHLAIRIFSDLEPVLMWQPIVVSVVFAVGTGIIFGVIPAYKASRKDPIHSLRLY